MVDFIQAVAGSPIDHTLLVVKAFVLDPVTNFLFKNAVVFGNTDQLNHGIAVPFRLHSGFFFLSLGYGHCGGRYQWCAFFSAGDIADQQAAGKWADHFGWRFQGES
ncbi:MAG TPA: hypothetical protein VK979_09180, partial [Guyparkeria sp.]|nr:hypothetical protein [Guyparkeria sp.]